MKENFSKKIVVIYHGSCTDGFGGAWTAWQKFGDKAHYYGAGHNDEPLHYLRNKEIYFIDFSYTEPIMRKLLRNGNRVVSLEHHASHEHVIKLAQEYRYDIRHSGCVLAWQYFFPKRPVPRLLRNIEDIDLWNFKLSGTREARAILETYDMNFKTWTKLAKQWEASVGHRKLLAEGRTIMRFQDKRVEELVRESAQDVVLAGQPAKAVNAPFLEDFIANGLIKAGAAVGIVWRVRKHDIRFSLRSDGSVDVGRIAQGFGGGGHKVSSGFSLPPNSALPWTVSTKKKGVRSSRS